MSTRKWFQVLVVMMVTALLLAFSGIASAQGNSGNAFERAKEAQERHTAQLMAKAGVVGTAVGLNDQQQEAVLVLLEKPGIGGLPQELEGVPVHPVVTGKIEALKPPGKPAPSFDPTARCKRPVFIGVSTGHPLVTAGTIGCRVTDGSHVYALSNNHIYANEGDAFIGDYALQPGVYDGGTAPGDVIGTLFNFKPIVFSKDAANDIDAAIALCTTDTLGNSTPAVGGYGKPSAQTKPAVIGLKVQKYGRTTKLTSGKVFALNASVTVQYGTGKVAGFVGQIIVNPGSFSAGGDSGSLIVTESGNNPVGLLFAGSSSYTIANPIDAVLGHFGVAVDAR